MLYFFIVIITKIIPNIKKYLQITLIFKNNHRAFPSLNPQLLQTKRLYSIKLIQLINLN
jgi:hypothetical protein